MAEEKHMYIAIDLKSFYASVECIERQSDGVYLSVEGYLYKLEDLYAVVDEDYYTKLMEESTKL